jgi:hypothetical protein
MYFDSSSVDDSIINTIPQALHLILIIFDTTNTLPTLPKLTSLTLQNFGESPIFNIPHTCNITHLVTATEFNSITDKLPFSLTHLTFGDNFGQPVDKLPPTLTHLTTGYSFNQSVDNLPFTLTHLTTGYYFNQPVDKLPPTLTHLRNSINKLINSLPHSLTSQLEIVSTNQLIRCHSHLLTS